MAENETPDTTPAEIKTTTDLQIEKLTARLDALESENRELKNANQGLWAQLHPVQDAPAPIPSAGIVQAPPASADTAYDAVVKALGIKEE